jgi:DNA-binding LacI/PurR family transcriptional regulator
MRRVSTTMRDVARHAGVSIQTVSCVINETGNISADTRSRVLQSIEELNYRRNPIARSMRTQQTRMIALVVMDITNPVLSVIASTIEADAYAQDYSVLLYNTGIDPTREQIYLDEIGDRRADGVIIINAIERANAAQLIDAQVPTVLIDCAVPNSLLPTVSVDNVQGAYLATDYLVKLGHHRIAHIGGSSGVQIARQRELAYLKALADAGLSYRRSFPSPTIQWGYANGYRAMHELLQENERPTAVFAASDELAIGAYRALAEAGLRIPDDISIVGFDNIEAAAYTNPPLTTVHQPFPELGHRALSLLLDMLDGTNPRPGNVVLPAELIVRQSAAEVR